MDMSRAERQDRELERQARLEWQRHNKSQAIEQRPATPAETRVEAGDRQTRTSRPQSE
jgi:hypothetical protein